MRTEVREARPVIAVLAALVLTLLAVPFAHAGFDIGTASQFAVLSEASSTSLQFNNGVIDGDIGIGSPRTFQASGPGTINGDIRFSGASSVSGLPAGNIQWTGSVVANDAAVASALSTVNSLAVTLGNTAGNALDISIANGATQTVNVSSGLLDGNGNRVFTVGTLNLSGGSTLVINGSASDYVVFNINQDADFKGAIQLTGGITSDHVLFNIIGGTAAQQDACVNTGVCTGGHKLNLNTNDAIVTGIFLDAMGVINENHSVLDGRLFGGDTQNMSIVSGGDIHAPTTVPEPATLLLVGTALAAGGAAVRRRRARSQALPV